MDYRIQPTVVLFNAAVLTAAYTGNRSVVLNVNGMSKLSLDINYARGAAEAASKALFQIEHTPDDGVNWYSLVIDETGTTSVLTAREWEIGTTNKLNVILDIAYSDIRVSVKESGVVTNAGTLTMTAISSGF